MKTLIIYYSYDGNCQKAAEIIGEKCGADLLRLEAENEKHRDGFAKFFWGGLQVFSPIKPKLKPYSIDFSGYEMIIIGTPVWAGAPAPVIQSFLSKEKISG
jgi:flavodoxin